MGRRPGSKNKVKTDNVEISIHENPSVKPTVEADPVQQKNKEILKERSKVITKQKPGKQLFHVEVMDGGDERLNWLSKAMAEYFGFASCGFRDGIKRWDFPHSIKDKFKRHIVFRQYAYKNIMVDVFDKGTPLAEIKRIKGKAMLIIGSI